MRADAPGVRRLHSSSRRCGRWRARRCRGSWRRRPGRCGPRRARPSAMTRPSSRQYTRSLMLMISGMSCSMTSTDAPSSRRMSLISGPNASVSRWARPAVGSSRQSTRASSASSPASSTIAPGAGREVGDVGVGVAAEAEEVDEVVGLGAGPLGRTAAAGTARRSSPVRCRASSATCTVSRTVSSGNSVAAWNVRPSPRRARADGESDETSSPSELDGARARDVAADGVHQRRLAGAVGADQADDLAGADLDRDARRRRRMPPKRTPTSVASRARLARRAWARAPMP